MASFYGVARIQLQHRGDFSPYANALSHINALSWSQAHLTQPIETLEFLLNIGYNLGQQSSNGLTPLLFAAAQHMPQLIKCLRLCIDRGTDQYATTFEGEGVLHLTLAAPDIHRDWSGTLDDSSGEEPCNTLYESTRHLSFPEKPLRRISGSVSICQCRL